MKKIKLIIFSDFISSFSVSAFITYAYWFLYKATKDQSIVSTIGTITMLAVLGSMMGGSIVDQSSKLVLLRIIAFIRIITLIIALTILAIGGSNIYIVIAIVILNACLNTVYMPLTESIAPTFIQKDEDIVSANSWVSLASQVSSIVSSGFSVIMVMMKDPKYSLIFVMISVIISFVSLSRIKADDKPQIHSDTSSFQLRSKIKEGISLIYKNHLVSIMIPIALVTNFCYWTIWLLMPKFSVDIYGKYSFTYNFIDIGVTIGGILGTVVLTKLGKRIGELHFYPVYLAGQALSLLLLGLLSLVPFVNIINVILVGVIWFLYGFFNSITAIIYFSAVQMSASKSDIGKTVGAVLTIFSVANPIAGITSPFLLKLAGLRPLIIVLGLIMFLAALIIYTPPYMKVLIENEK
ncbi:MFS transporter [Companilactobacillus paralimentarius]|uniref:MFS transporter n=1 Tax=Companilactobacillus paralimentarius TaxID=83526 RepID=UPI00384B535B